MNITLEITRYDATRDEPHYVSTHVVAVEPTDRVLDALLIVSLEQDPTLSFRKSCAHGVCGSDAMRINGREALGCKTLIQDAISEERTKDGNPLICVEPLRHLPVLKDLVVDQQPFFEKFEKVKPFLHPESSASLVEYLQSPKDRELFDDGTKCINCSACYSACPVIAKNPQFLGPSALVQAARFVFDSRDEGLTPRLSVLDHKDGVWACENHFECTRVCPREIKVTKMINLTKRAIKKYREARGEATAEPVDAKA